MDRRGRDRFTIAWKVRVSSASERRLPEARLVDASREGALMVLDEPTGFAVGQSIVVSIEPADDAFVLLADVVRLERGIDFRTYVAVTFRTQAADELDRWEARLAEGEDDADAPSRDVEPPADGLASPPRRRTDDRVATEPAIDGVTLRPLASARR